MTTLVIAGVRTYQRIRDVFVRPCCRYVPSCSDYMIESIEKKGLFYGLIKGVLRIGRCHPWGGYGHDPVI